MVGERAMVMLDSPTMTPKVDTEKLVTVSTAAKILKISRAGVYKAIERGRLEALEIGGVLFINRTNLPSYRKSKSVGGRPKKKKT
jgi:excisionase family DNA binding protein